MTSATIETDVLIIGGGIAGPALACALRDSALKITMLEKSDAPLDTARGDHLQPMTCEILERWSVLDDFFRAGAEKRLNSLWMTPDGELLMRSAIGELDVPHPYFAFLNHENISAVLLEAAAQSPRFELVRPIRNWWLENGADGRTLVRVSLAGGSDVRFSAAMLVGADGRASRTRKLMKIDSETHRYQNAIAILFADRLDRAPNDSLRVYISDSHMISVIPRTGGGCKIGIPMDSADVADWRQAASNELRDRLIELIPDLKIDNVRFGDIYPPIFLETKTWVQGNVVLIGDACHAMHPARSQGMNIAIRCVDALAERLRQSPSPLDPALVRKALLDYQAQVRPEIDAVLLDNHRRGLEMDDQSGAGYGKLIDSMQKLQANAEALRRYSMNAAGYGVENG